MPVTMRPDVYKIISVTHLKLLRHVVHFKKVIGEIFPNELDMGDKSYFEVFSKRTEDLMISMHWSMVLRKMMAHFT